MRLKALERIKTKASSVYVCVTPVAHLAYVLTRKNSRKRSTPQHVTPLADCHAT